MEKMYTPRAYDPSRFLRERECILVICIWLSKITKITKVHKLYASPTLTRPKSSHERSLYLLREIEHSIYRIYRIFCSSSSLYIKSTFSSTDPCSLPIPPLSSSPLHIVSYTLSWSSTGQGYLLSTQIAGVLPAVVARVPFAASCE